MQHARLLSFCAVAALCLFSAWCGSGDEGDLPVLAGEPPPAGKGDRIHEIADPASPKKAAHKSLVSVTGAVVVAVDRFDETLNGKSTGTIYVADLGSKEPYSGISLFSPKFIPGNLRVGAGDALDLRGEYQETQSIGSTVTFAPGAFLPQLGTPIGTFRFDAQVPEPVVIKIEDLADFAEGRKWINMLVTVKNVTLERDAFGTTSSGRITAALLPEDKDASASTKCETPFPKPPTLVNELMDLSPLQLKKGTVLTSLTGVVTFFCNLHIAPRSAADIVQQGP